MCQHRAGLPLTGGCLFGVAILRRFPRNGGLAPAIYRFVLARAALARTSCTRWPSVTMGTTVGLT